jgi:Zn-dependent protease with chaperone function
MNLVRFLFALLSVAVMAALSIGVLVHAGQWGWWAFQWCAAHLQTILVEFDVSHTLVAYPVLPDPMWAIKWTLIGVAVVTGLNCLRYALTPLRRQAINSFGGKRRAPGFTRVENHQLVDITADIRNKSDVDLPVTLYAVETTSPVAFAMSAPGQALIAVSIGLVRALTTQQLRWVIAHEMAHIRYRDSFPSAFYISAIGSVQRVVVLLFAVMNGIAKAMWKMRLPGLLVSPVLLLMRVLATWTSFVLSAGKFCFLLADRFAIRKIEFRADAWASEIEGPRAGVETLELLKGDAEPTYNGLMATHPRTQERIKRLFSLMSEEEKIPSLIGR